jgi:hypothetical protein
MAAAVYKFLPLSLSPSLAADSYFQPKVAEIRHLAERDAVAVADLDIRIESGIPTEIVGARKVIVRLRECLDNEKISKPILRGDNDCEHPRGGCGCGKGETFMLC